MLRNCIENLSTDWKDILLQYPHWGHIEECYQNELTKPSQFDIYPHTKNIFACFDVFNTHELKVVLLGQDPYHGENQANGFAFAVNTSVKAPPSLKNIFKMLPNKSTDQDLFHWTKQGVLLLNTYLTVRERAPTSHAYIWKDFALWLLKRISQMNPILIVWGAHAHTIAIQTGFMDKPERVCVSSHPSPLSAYKKYKNYPSFFESNVFEKVNHILLQNGDSTIVW